MVSLVALSLLLGIGLSAAENNNITTARIEEFPSVVQIEFETGPIWVQTCVGTIITNYHILTAAHCFYGAAYAPRYRRVRAGATFRSRDGVILAIDRAVNHPSFNARDSEADISVVRLATALTFGSTIQTSPIPAQDSYFGNNARFTFASWGRTAQIDIPTNANRQLHKGTLRTVSHGYCTDIYRTLDYIIYLPITYDMFCVSDLNSIGTNIGLRDTGAPLFYDGVIAGVLVFGTPIEDAFPMIAVTVSSFTRWIVANAV